MSRHVLARARDIWFAAAMLIGACAQSPPEETTWVVGDSAGVTISTVGGDVLQRLPLYTLTRPNVRVGVIEGDARYQLHGVAGATRLADGTIVVLNGGSSELRWYSPDGRFVRSVGRPGRGPGEFAHLLTLQTGGQDTLIVHDMVQARFTYFSTDGDVLGTFALPERVSGFVGRLSSGLAAAAAPEFQQFTVERLRDPPTIVRIVDLETGSHRTVARAGHRQEYVWQSAERVIDTAVPFTARPDVAVHGDSLAIIDGLAPEVRFYDSSGLLKRIIRLAVTPEPVRRAEFDQLAVQLVLRAPPVQRPELRRVYGMMPRPAYKPTVDGVLIASDGRIWLRSFDHDFAATRSWIVLSTTGEAVARVEVPRQLRIREAGEDYVLGVLTDEAGVQYVHVYELKL